MRNLKKILRENLEWVELIQQGLDLAIKDGYMTNDDVLDIRKALKMAKRHERSIVKPKGDEYSVKLKNTDMEPVSIFANSEEELMDKLKDYYGKGRLSSLQYEKV